MSISIHSRTVVGVFDDYSTAQAAIEQLKAEGFSGDEIEINSRNLYSEEAGRGNVGLSGKSPSDQSAAA